MKQGEILGGLLVLAIILYAVISAVGPGTKVGNGWQYLVGGKLYDQNRGLRRMGTKSRNRDLAQRGYGKI